MDQISTGQASATHLGTAEQAAICFHFVDNPNDFSGYIRGSKGVFPVDHTPHREPCSVVTSMELDLIAFKFQDEHLMQTNLIYQREGEDPAPQWSAKSCTVDVIIPDVIAYTTEGRIPRLVSRNGTFMTHTRPPFPAAGFETIRCVARLARTYFKRSRIVVWNLILQRPCGSVLHEYDLIKLMHLYDGRTEGTDLARRARFVVHPLAGGEPRPVPLHCLIEAVWDQLAGVFFTKRYARPFSLGPIKRIDKRPAGATIQLAMGSDFGGKPVEDVLRVVLSARTADFMKPGSSQADGELGPLTTLEGWLDPGSGSRVGGALKALAGVTNAIFDFEEVDEEEVIDTLEPTFHSGDSFIKVHRRSLINICDSDRALSAVGKWLGISPYLILPHCVVLHNEELTDRTEKSLADFEDSIRIRELERLQEVCRKAMRTLYLPNIFNYVTEKTVYERAFQLRGSAQKRQVILDRMHELEGSVEEAYERRRSRHDVAVQILLLVLALGQVLAIFTDPTEMRSFLPVALVVSFIVFVVAAIFIVLSRQARGSRSKK